MERHGECRVARHALARLLTASHWRQDGIQMLNDGRIKYRVTKKILPSNCHHRLEAAFGLEASGAALVTGLVGRLLVHSQTVQLSCIADYGSCRPECRFAGQKHTTV